MAKVKGARSHAPIAPVGPEEALRNIKALPNGRTSFKNLARFLGLKGDRRDALEKSLDQLVAEGRLIENRKGHYRLPKDDRSLIPGRFSQHPSGFGFVKPQRGDQDIYIPRREATKAMHGDRVLVKIAHIKSDGRVEGRISRILDRQQSLLPGEFHYSPQGSYVVPHDGRVKGNIEILPGHELPPPDAAVERLGNVDPPRVETPKHLHGMMVTVEITEFPTRFQEARGRVVEALGRKDDFGVDVELVIRKHHLPYRFSPEALEEAEAVPEEIPADELSRRKDYRDLPIVTIDGESARDFDDAVYVDRLDGGGYELQVHIADVSHYVRPGSALDRDARLRGTSAYFPDRAVPMLPARLSSDICSLRPGVDRLVFSMRLEITAQGETRKAEFHRGVIRSAERMTYTRVFELLEADDPAPRFELMRDLAEILMRRRERRGSIDLDVPEAEIQFDDQHRMVGVKRAERNIAHRIIEEFMLAANEAVARKLLEAKQEFLHRIHEKPRGRSVVEFESIARSFGHSLGIDVGRKTFQRSRRHRDGSKSLRSVQVSEDVQVTSQDYQRFIKAIRGLPEERILSYRMLRSLQQARYSEQNKGHFALATDAYLHFTSPIRRYPDLVVHRILAAYVESPEAPKAPFSTEQLAQLADETSYTERRAADAERELIDWKKSRFMEERLGDEFDGQIVSVTEGGLWVELAEFYVEGLVPVDSFTNDHFHYRENLRALVGARSKMKFGLGDKVRVRVDRIAFDRLRPEFSIL